MFTEGNLGVEAVSLPMHTAKSPQKVSSKNDIFQEAERKK